LPNARLTRSPLDLPMQVDVTAVLPACRAPRCNAGDGVTEPAMQPGFVEDDSNGTDGPTLGIATLDPTPRYRDASVPTLDVHTPVPRCADRAPGPLIVALSDEASSWR